MYSEVRSKGKSLEQKKGRENNRPEEVVTHRGPSPTRAAAEEELEEFRPFTDRSAAATIALPKVQDDLTPRAAPLEG